MKARGASECWTKCVMKLMAMQHLELLLPVIWKHGEAGCTQLASVKQS